MWEALKKLAGSRKVIVAVAGAAAWLAGRLGFDVPAETMIPVVVPAWGVLLGLALEDHGKARTAILAAIGPHGASGGPSSASGTVIAGKDGGK